MSIENSNNNYVICKYFQNIKIHPVDMSRLVVALYLLNVYIHSMNIAQRQPLNVLKIFIYFLLSAVAERKAADPSTIFTCQHDELNHHQPKRPSKTEKKVIFNPPET